MDNNAIKGSGPSFIGDLARQGGDVVAGFTDTGLAGSGPNFVGDLVRMGGELAGPQISGDPVLTAAVEEAYEGFTVSASGGSEPYTFALVGTWPDGITINSSTGVVSGTPTEDGTFADLSVKVTDDAAEEAMLPSFTLTVAAE